MNVEELRDYCINKPAVTEHFPFDEVTLVFKVGTADKNKMFALCSLDGNPLAVNLKCDPEKAIELRENYDSIIPGFHMNKRHWNTVYLNGDVGTQLLIELIDHSYNLVISSLSKKAQAIIKGHETK